jgi:hypothetical protein
MRITLGVVLYAGCAWAQSGIEVPAIGATVDTAGTLRVVQGVAGNFWLGPAIASEVLSAACSERMCLAKTDSKILSATGETDAPPGPAIFGLNGNDAIVYFPESRVFARWHEDALDLLDWRVDGEVFSVRLKEIAVRREGEVSIVHSDGSVVVSIPDGSGPVLLLPEGVLFATRDQIVLRRDHRELRLELTGAESITAMGPHYALVRTGHEIYALRIEAGHEALYQLPGSAP